MYLATCVNMSNITLYVDAIISLPNYFANLLRQSLYNICDLLNISVAFAFPFMTLFFLSTKTFGFMNEACSKRENHEKLQVQLLDFKKNAFQNLVLTYISLQFIRSFYSHLSISSTTSFWKRLNNATRVPWAIPLNLFSLIFLLYI